MPCLPSERRAQTPGLGSTRLPPPELLTGPAQEKQTCQSGTLSLGVRPLRVQTPDLTSRRNTSATIRVLFRTARTSFVALAFLSFLTERFQLTQLVRRDARRAARAPTLSQELAEVDVVLTCALQLRSSPKLRRVMCPQTLPLGLLSRHRSSVFPLILL